MSGSIIGYAEHLIDFSNMKIIGWNTKLLISLILIFSFLSVLGIHIIITEGFSDEVFAGILVSFSMALIFGWILSWGKGASIFHDTRFSLKYIVRVSENGYSLDLGLSCLSVGMVSMIRVYIVTAYSYGMVKPRYKGIRILCNGGILDREIILEDMIYEGYSRNISFNPRSLKCTTCMNIRSVRGIFRFTAGSFIVVEAVAKSSSRAYAVIPIIYTSLLNERRSIVSIEGVKAEVSIDSKKARVRLRLQEEKQYSSAEIGLLYVVEASFTGRERYRKEIKMPLTSIKLLDKSTDIEIDLDHIAEKVIGKIAPKPKKQIKPFIDLASSAESYACNASIENLYLPPVYTSHEYRGITIKMGYYVILKSLLRSKRVFVESPLPPDITKTYALGRKHSLPLLE